jgi:DMSO/TMAO reductase YedYZ molybdopterin-dependent catalytic subunit/thiosulfate reductase cytochrome b subunit
MAELDRGGVHLGRPLFVRITHWLTAAAVLGLVVSGATLVLTHPRLYWGETGAAGGPALLDLPLPLTLGISGWGRYLHFLSAWICVLTGLAYVTLGLTSSHLRRTLLPPPEARSIGALRKVLLDHLRFRVALGGAGEPYNLLQQVTYLAVVFVLFPAMIWTGLAMSPALTSPFPVLVRVLGGHQSARTVHFFVACALVLFVVVHLVMVFAAGFRARVRGMVMGRTRGTSLGPGAAAGISRRRILRSGLTVAAGAGGLVGAVHLGERHGLVPPDHRGPYGAGETLTYASQRLLTTPRSLAREFDRSQISQVAPVNGPHPETEEYQRLLDSGFADWRLEIEGAVQRPMTVSLADLRAMPARSQITHQACEEGWSFIAEWTGVPLSLVLERVGVLPRARWVAVYAHDTWWESIDMNDALHPQTLLAYGMNGSALPLDHGAPVRLRVARQLGYKSVKYLARLRVVESLRGLGSGLGGTNAEVGYSWWAGI